MSKLVLSPARWVFLFFLHYSAPPPTSPRAAVAGSEPLPEHDVGLPLPRVQSLLLLAPLCVVRLARLVGRLEMGAATVTPSSKRDSASALRKMACQRVTACLRSYSLENFVRDRLVKQIERLDGVWIDRQAHGLAAYAAPIVRAIKTLACVALMCSRTPFSRSRHRQVYIAVDHKKPFYRYFSWTSPSFPTNAYSSPAFPLSVMRSISKGCAPNFPGCSSTEQAAASPVHCFAPLALDDCKGPISPCMR